MKDGKILTQTNNREQPIQRIHPIAEPIIVHQQTNNTTNQTETNNTTNQSQNDVTHNGPQLIGVSRPDSDEELNAYGEHILVTRSRLPRSNEELRRGNNTTTVNPVDRLFPRTMDIMTTAFNQYMQQTQVDDREIIEGGFRVIMNYCRNLENVVGGVLGTSRIEPEQEYEEVSEVIGNEYIDSDEENERININGIGNVTMRNRDIISEITTMVRENRNRDPLQGFEQYVQNYTQEQRDAVVNIINQGFHPSEVIQMYEVCNHDANLTMNNLQL